MATTTAAHDVVVIESAARLDGELRLPGDKSISHRALMVALLANGRSRIAGAGDGEDVRSTAAIVAALGAEVERTPTSDGVDYVVSSPGLDGLRAPSAVLDCGNSGTTMRLFAGILAGRPFASTLDGDASLRSRPMARVIQPLRAMGASVSGTEGRAPLRIDGGSVLAPIAWTSPVPSAQVKSAILLAGIQAAGTTSIQESVATRDHTERMLRASGIAVRTVPPVEASGGTSVRVEVDGPARPLPLDVRVPGDISAAAFWMVAAAIHPKADVRLIDVGINPTRRGVIGAVTKLGVTQRVAGVDLGDIGETVADIRTRTSTSPLSAFQLDAVETARTIDEIPILCLGATQARGQSVIRGAGELRHKESDRIAGIVAGLTALGARIEAVGDDIVIEGPTPLHGADVDSLGDHRLALTFAIAGLVATGRTTIRGANSVAISYPTFFADLERIRS